MDASRLRTGELIAGGAAIVLFVVMFLPWFGVGGAAGEALQQAQDLGFAPDIDTSANAWQAFDFIDVVLFVTIIVAVAFAAATALSQTVALPVAASSITAGLGILSTILILYRVIDPVGEDVSRKFWLYIGLIAAAAIAYGGWRSMQEEGTSFGAQGDRVRDRMGGDRPPPPPPSSGGPAA